MNFLKFIKLAAACQKYFFDTLRVCLWQTLSLSKTCGFFDRQRPARTSGPLILI